MPGIYTGPINWHWIGDQDKCQLLQGRARACVQSLFEVVERSGAKNSWGLRQRRWAWPDFVVTATVMIDLRGRRVAWCEIFTSGQQSESVLVGLPTDGIVWMEHGLLTIDLSALIANPNTTSAKVWLPSDIASYYTGVGTLIPGSNPERAQHFVKRLIFDAALTPNADLPDGIPTITSGWHSTVHGSGAAALEHLVVPRNPPPGYLHAQIYPERYTGLARAWAQAWLGAGLTVTNLAMLLPGGWDLSPGVLGLVRDPADGGAYWALNATASGLKAVLMRPQTAAAAEVAQWLEDGDLTGMPADLAAAYPLAALKAQGLPVTLIAAEDMAPLYAGQGTTVPDSAVTLFDDATPDGAAVSGWEDTWTWSTDRAKSGTHSHMTGTSFFRQYHTITQTAGFNGPLPDTALLACWVWFEAGKNVPLQLGLAFRVMGSANTHLAYWGQQWFASTFTKSYLQGDVPDARGQWVQIVVSAGELGLEGKTLDRVYFVSVLNDYSKTPASVRARIWWDQFQVITPGISYASGDAWSDQGGWIWSDTVAEGAIVNRRVVNPRIINEASESLLARVAVTWTNGTPTATVTASGWAKWRPYWAYHKFWYGLLGADLTLLRHGRIYPGAADCAASAPVIVTWDGAALKTLSYHKAQVTGAGTHSASGSLVGCYGGDETYIGAGIQRISGGYGWTGPPEPFYVGTGTVRVRQWEITASGDWGTPCPPEPDRCRPGTSWSNIQLFWFGVTCGDTQLEQFPGGQAAINAALQALNDAGKTYNGAWVLTAMPGAITATWDEYSFTGAGGVGAQLLCYLRSAPDLLWQLAMPGAASGSTLTRYTFAGTGDYQLSVSHIFQDYFHTCPGVGYYPNITWACHYMIGAKPKGWNSGGWQGTGTTVINLNTALGHESCFRRGASIYAEETDGNGWGPLTTDGREPVQIDLWGQASAGGVVFFKPRPGADTLSHAWTGSAPDGDIRAFVGTV